ncbi:hypothetical protein CSUB01_11553, partial [Colletotrichum sublineola]
DLYGRERAWFDQFGAVFKNFVLAVADVLWSLFTEDGIVSAIGLGEIAFPYADAFRSHEKERRRSSARYGWLPPALDTHNYVLRHTLDPADLCTESQIDCISPDNVCPSSTILAVTSDNIISYRTCIGGSWSIGSLPKLRKASSASVQSLVTTISPWLTSLANPAHLPLSFPVFSLLTNDPANPQKQTSHQAETETIPYTHFPASTRHSICTSPVNRVSVAVRARLDLDTDANLGRTGHDLVIYTPTQGNAGAQGLDFTTVH